MASSTNFSLYCIVFFLLVSAFSALSAPVPPPPTWGNTHRVTSLPGVGRLNFSMYSGMVTVNDTAGRALFYILTESTSGNLANDPLVLWLNGGPGCSSIGNGFMSELGPFYPAPNASTLLPNNYAFNRVANMLFLDSPAFVGWSYSNRSSDVNTGDAQTAADSYEFLQRWLFRFPQYRNRPFWIAGESYGGHYVPDLALQIVKANAAGQRPKINLQGIFLGNPWTDPGIDDSGMVTYWYTHGLISDRSYIGLHSYCNLSYGLPGHQSYSEIFNYAKCNDYYNQAYNEQGNIYPYDILADVCLPQGLVAQAQQMTTVMRNSLMGNGFKAHQSQERSAQPPYDPCVDNAVAMYLNRADVQQALHANVSGTLPGPWTGCNYAVFNGYSSYDNSIRSMVPVYQQLLRTSRLKMLIYSGDIDSVVPLIGTRIWVDSLSLAVTDPWRTWTSTTGQIGGWTSGYSQNFRFATVRGAGHMVPYVQPERALYLFTQWIKNKAP